MPEHPIVLEASWRDRVGDYLQRPDMRALADFLRQEKAKGKKIYPRGADMFAALNATPFEQVKVVILGQDPYHGPGQAHGLCFSVQPGIDIPPSLKNIYAELKTDCGIPTPAHGCLTHWAEQGVLLLNAVLSVEDGKPGSHQGKGWEGFTDHIVAQLNEQHQGLVFMLWGSYAQAKGKVIDTRKHCVLRAPHPSPLSAYRGFMGCGHFSAANRWLNGGGKAPIDWSVPEIGLIPAP
jgi:uracil-DNA glycosylase